jgi:type IV pilus assembly protein PilY1
VACTNGTTCTPLFVAQDGSATPKRQPITSSPLVVRHPNGGVVVLFGTGKYLENSDTTGPFSTQSYYGVWDNDPLRTTSIARSSLLQQKVAGVVTVTDAGGVANDFRVTTDYCINGGSVSGFDVANNNAVTVACDSRWTQPSAKKGWYMDLPASGERVAYNAIVRNDRVVFPTLIPSTTPCLAGGDSWLMELDALTGRRLAVSPFDSDGNGVVSGADLLTFNAAPGIAAGGMKPSGGGILTTPTVIKSGTNPSIEYKYSSSSTGTVVRTVESVSGGGRISWRELPQ